jgi:hypothetical protein
VCGPADDFFWNFSFAKRILWTDGFFEKLSPIYFIKFTRYLIPYKFT